MNFLNIRSSPPEARGLIGYVTANTIKTVEVSCFHWPISAMERKNAVSVLHLFF